MHAALRLPYAALGALAEGASALVAWDGGKITASFAGRRHAAKRLAAWGAAQRDTARPLVWFHAPSVGEGLQARPVLQMLRQRHGEVQLAYTHFSPSARRFALSVGADVADYLPFDTRHAARAMLDALRPTALVFSKLDVWPVLVDEASRRGVKLALIAGTLAEGSGREGRLARALLGDAYAALDRVGAIDEANAARLVALGARADRVIVTGDTRYDQVWERAARVDRTSALLAPFDDDRPTLVSGSTWPADEQVLAEAWRALQASLPGARLVIAPHEPTPAHLASIETWVARAGWRSARLGASDASAADVVVVDRMGVLGDLYAIADAAFVGGGFHAAGLHSVLEPAAFGAPVLFGPRHQGSRDAGLLIAAGGGATVADVPALATRLRVWLGDAAARTHAGAAARGVVQSGLGAAERSAELVAALL